LQPLYDGDDNRAKFGFLCYASSDKWQTFHSTKDLTENSLDLFRSNLCPSRYQCFEQLFRASSEFARRTEAEVADPVTGASFEFDIV